MKGVSLAFWEVILSSASELGGHGEKTGHLIHLDIFFLLPWTSFATSSLMDRIRRRNHLGSVGGLSLRTFPKILKTQDNITARKVPSNF